jgi:hypothetical protein
VRIRCYSVRCQLASAIDCEANSGFTSAHQVKAGVKKRLIIFVRNVEILDQTQQSCPIETSKL